jgi:Zn-finger nucleic acid-binding protein
MRCTACAATIDASSAFPGATLRCTCGMDNVVPLPPRPQENTPYRDAGFAQPSAGLQAAMISCPFCGGPCASEARACPHCNVELAAVRCPECYALHFTGARFCSRCRAELHAGPLLVDASDAPCPRCDKPLRTTPESGVFECVTCGGLFVDHTAFAAMAHEKEVAARVFAGAAEPTSRVLMVEAEVHYVKCPVCSEVMNRVNFGHRSGVIVDICGHHGTWFDPGELTRVLEWIAGGGLADERARERTEHTRESHETHQAHALEARGLLDQQGDGIKPGHALERSLETLIDLVATFFFPDR